jgi:hypothetical protein
MNWKKHEYKRAAPRQEGRYRTRIGRLHSALVREPFHLVVPQFEIQRALRVCSSMWIWLRVCAMPT